VNNATKLSKLFIVFTHQSQISIQWVKGLYKPIIAINKIKIANWSPIPPLSTIKKSTVQKLLESQASLILGSDSGYLDNKFKPLVPERKQAAYLGQKMHGNRPILIGS